MIWNVRDMFLLVMNNLVFFVVFGKKSYNNSIAIELRSNQRFLKYPNHMNPMHLRQQIAPTTVPQLAQQFVQTPQSFVFCWLFHCSATMIRKPEITTVQAQFAGHVNPLDEVLPPPSNLLIPCTRDISSKASGGSGNSSITTSPGVQHTRDATSPAPQEYRELSASNFPSFFVSFCPVRNLSIWYRNLANNEKCGDQMQRSTCYNNHQYNSGWGEISNLYR